jgi:hypothetical protein
MEGKGTHCIHHDAHHVPIHARQLACAGCTIQDELFASFEQVLGLGDKNGVQYDRIVLENSGVAEPQNIRDAFSEARENGHPVMSRVHLSSLVRSLCPQGHCRPLVCNKILCFCNPVAHTVSCMIFCPHHAHKSLHT